MKIAFFGTSDKSTPLLQALHENFELVLCVTKTDTKVGRNQEVRETEVKKWAKEHSVDYVEVSSLGGENRQKVVEALQKHNIKLGIVADFDFIIPPEIFTTPNSGLLNLHFSLLPKYRGASPIQHALLNQEEKTGITFQLVERGLDTGDIVKQIEYPLTGHETTQELYKALFDKAAAHIPDIIKGYVSGDLEPRPQNEDEATYCYSPSHPKSTYIFKEDAKIDWADTPSEIYAQIRAYYPWPIAWTTLEDIHKNVVELKKSDNTRVKIFDADLIGDNDQKELEIKTLQVAGKNKVSWQDFLNGYVLK